MAKIVILVGVNFLALLVTPLIGQSTPFESVVNSTIEPPLLSSEATDNEIPAMPDNLETTGMPTPVGRQSSGGSSTINAITISTSTSPSITSDSPKTTAADDETGRTRHNKPIRGPDSPNTTMHYHQPGSRTSTTSMTYSESSRNNEDGVAISNISSVHPYDDDSRFSDVSKVSVPSQSGQTNEVDEMAWVSIVCYQETCSGGDCVTFFNDTTPVCPKSDQGSCSITQRGDVYTADCKEYSCSFESDNDIVVNCCQSSKCNNNMNLLKGHGITVHLNMFLLIVAACLQLFFKY